jgi:hypothetical protein
MADVRAHARPCLGPRVVCEDVFGDLWWWLWNVMHLGVGPLVQSAAQDDPALFAAAMQGFQTAVDIADGTPLPADGTPIPAEPGVYHPGLDSFLTVGPLQAPGTAAGLAAVADGYDLLRADDRAAAEVRFRAAGALLAAG